jgi:predicted PurR-regulated permease PerM
MHEITESSDDRDLMRRATEVAIRLLVLAVLGLWCFLIFRPFLTLIVWGIVIAVALRPAHARLASLLGGRSGWAGGIFIAIGIGCVVLPGYFLSESFYAGIQWLGAGLDLATIAVPPPPESVAAWPLIGSTVHGAWMSASHDLEATLTQLSPELRSAGAWLVSTISGLGIAVAVTIASIVVAGLMLVHAESGARVAHAVGARLAGEQGRATVDLAASAIRSVAKGVVGVAVVQSIGAAVGLVLADVPAAGLWAVLVLVLAVAQLPPLLVLAPAIAWVIATSDSAITQLVFTIWSIVVSVSDSFLKPMFLGRGMEIPMPIILIGAIGGMLRSGIVGLFVGAVVMAVGYSIFVSWMGTAPAAAPEPAQPTPEPTPAA